MSGTGEDAPARPGKGAAAFRTIGEVADELNLPAHVLRFWELKFAQLKPLKRGGGRRYYRPEDVALLRRIRQCLYQDGYTIRGVQRLLGGVSDDAARAGDPARSPSLFPLEEVAPDQPSGRSQGRSPPPRRVPRHPPAPESPGPETPAPETPAPETRAALEEIRWQLLDARRLLDGLVRRPKDP